MQTSFKNIRRAPYQTLAAIFVVSITMFVVSVFLLVSLGSHQILLNFETRPQIIAYLKDGHTPEQVSSLLTTLINTSGVKKAIYISKDDALEIYKKSVGNDPIMLGTVTDWGIVTADIMPASVEITAQSPQEFDKISGVLETSDLVSVTPQGKKEIDFPKDFVDVLTKWTNAIRTGGLFLVVILLIVSIVTIIMIISMKIAARRAEIKTLKLMGASNFFIMKPHLQESLIYGVTGSVIGWLFCFILLLYTTPMLASQFAGIISFPVPIQIMLLLLAAITVIGFVISLISGYFAAVRFLHRTR